MHLIDVHTIGAPQDYVIAHPCVVHHRHPYRAGRWVEARVEALLAGDAPFVSFTDPDDKVMPGAFDTIQPHLKAHKAVSTNSLRIDGQGIGRLWRPYWQEWSLAHHASHPLCVHQLVFIERNLLVRAIDEFMAFPADLRAVSQELIYAPIARLNGWHFSPDVAYVWFWRERGTGNTVDPALVRRTKDFIREYLTR